MQVIDRQPHGPAAAAAVLGGGVRREVESAARRPSMIGMATTSPASGPARPISKICLRLALAPVHADDRPHRADRRNRHRNEVRQRWPARDRRASSRSGPSRASAESPARTPCRAAPAASSAQIARRSGSMKSNGSTSARSAIEPRSRSNSTIRAAASRVAPAKNVESAGQQEQHDRQTDPPTRPRRRPARLGIGQLGACTIAGSASYVTPGARRGGPAVVRLACCDRSRALASVPSVGAE